MFQVNEAFGRDHSFTALTYKMITEMPHNSCQVSINNDKTIKFFRSIYKGYRRDVTYHNDLHGADVAQMVYFMIKHGNLDTIAQLNYLDLVAAITASACHDFDHDGFNNAYHVNFMTDRAVRYHDKAV